MTENQDAPPALDDRRGTVGVGPDGDGSVLVLLHRPVRPEPAVDYCTGWHVMLDALAVHLDGGDPGAGEPDFAALHETYSAAAPGS